MSFLAQSNSNLTTEKIKTEFLDFEKLCVEIIENDSFIPYDLLKVNGEDLNGVGPAKLIQKLKENKIKIFNYTTSKFETVETDFAGFYMFYKNGVPEYCGISRNVLKRLSDHTKGDKQSATFAHRLMMSNAEEATKGKKKTLKDYKREILSYQFKLVKFYKPCPETPNRHTISTEHQEEVLLYLFEVFASVYFGTKHNSFRTH